MSSKPLSYFLLFLLFSLITTLSLAQPSAAPESATATCTFDDGKEVNVRYIPVAAAKEKLPNGKIWAPGGTPMMLFTQADLLIANATLPVGAYSLYAIPGKSEWTLVVNKDVTAGAKYDEKDDLARASMDTGQVSQSLPTLDVAFAHTGPKQCTLRMYVGKIGAWADFKEK